MEKHALYEDILAVATGCLLVSFGASVFSQTQLMTGGMVGISLLIQYVTPLQFGLVFLLANLPFIVFSFFKLGPMSTMRTIAASILVSAFSAWAHSALELHVLNPIYAAVLGGLLTGIGLLILFRHRTGIGGLNVIAIFVQERLGWRAGYVQLGMDVTVLLISFVVLGARNALLSVISVAIVNSVLAINHKPGRYAAVS